LQRTRPKFALERNGLESEHLQTGQERVNWFI
jgi:hypothetical protein